MLALLGARPIEPDTSRIIAMSMPHWFCGSGLSSLTLMNRWFSVSPESLVYCTCGSDVPDVPTVTVPTYAWIWLPTPLESPP